MERKMRAKVAVEFDEMAMPHLNELYAMALRLTRHEKDAEDLVQDAFLKAYVHFDQFRRGTNCRAWLFRILTNSFINGYRRRAKEREILDVHEQAGDPAERFFSLECHDRYANPESRLLHDTVGDELKGALEALPVDFRTVVMLADVHEFSYREIAEMMATPVGTVMSRLFRGRRMLRQKLWRYAMELGILDAAPEDPVDPSRRRARRSPAPSANAGLLPVPA